MQEWLNWTLSKSVVPYRVPWVRIPPPPPMVYNLNQLMLNKVKTPKFIILCFVIVFAIIGAIFLFRSRAAVGNLVLDPENGTLVTATKVADANASGGYYAKFGTSSPVTGPCTSTTAPPKIYKHVVWIWFENRGYSQVSGSANAPYFNSLRTQCGEATSYVDNLFGTADLPSEPHYIAAVSGSNCNTGLSPQTGSTGCVTNDNDPVLKPITQTGPGTNQLSTISIFQQIQNHKFTDSGQQMTWKAYQEGMTNSTNDSLTVCRTASRGKYAAKHNPPLFFYNITNTIPGKATCVENDVPFPVLNCSSTDCSTIGDTLDDHLSKDIAGGTLPSFAFITPNLDNDMHDGSVARGDQWLKAYLTKILNGPNYKAGDTAVFVMFDESEPFNTAMPNIFIAPTVGKKVVKPMFNEIAVLKATEGMLGLPYLGCANNQPLGGVGTCPAGSGADLRTLFNL